METWENHLATRSTDRVVRAFDWGIEWTRNWPFQTAETDPEKKIAELNRMAIAHSEEFFAYKPPRDFSIEASEVRFTSAVETPYPENNTVRARYFPAKPRFKRGRKAVVLLPHWNSHAAQHVALCRGIAELGISAVRLSLPYHDKRMPAELHRADYAVSANVARTVDATRQAVIDVRSCLDWLQSAGYRDLGIVGTSLGSCYAFLASAHDARIKANVFNHCSTYFADVVWTGLSTRHIRQGIEGQIDINRLRAVWDCISPVHYMDRYADMAKRSFFLYATYDTTFPPHLSREIVEHIQARGMAHKLVVTPCGHYTLGEAPFKFVAGYQICNFLKRNL
ncbi:MAG: alpha/beta hydrolase family protein [Acidobacteriota bacterium]|nr:alpha/beta hydrolase family protein [Acidobacteriota bacterium]